MLTQHRLTQRRVTTVRVCSCLHNLIVAKSVTSNRPLLISSFGTGSIAYIHFRAVKLRVFDFKTCALQGIFVGKLIGEVQAMPRTFLGIAFLGRFLGRIIGRILGGGDLVIRWPELQGHGPPGPLTITWGGAHYAPFRISSKNLIEQTSVRGWAELSNRPPQLFPL